MLQIKYWVYFINQFHKFNNSINKNSVHNNKNFKILTIYHFVALNFVLQKSLLSAQNLVLEVFIVYTRNIEQNRHKNRWNIPNLTKCTELWRGPYKAENNVNYRQKCLCSKLHVMRYVVIVVTLRSFSLPNLTFERQVT